VSACASALLRHPSRLSSPTSSRRDFINLKSRWCERDCDFSKSEKLKNLRLAELRR
jgi:hypothetical protein